jgi:cation diffusion facilitator family transporter
MQNEGMAGIIYAEKVAKKGLISLAVLAVLKAVASLITGSVILMTDALSSISDIVTLLGSYVGLKLNETEGEGGFKYGYYKIETLIAFLIAVFIMVLGVAVFFKNIGQFKEAPQVNYPWVAIGVIMVTIVFSLRNARILREAGLRSNSLSLIHNAKEKQGDILASFMVLMAILASVYRIPYIESLVGVVISVLIFKDGITAVKDSVSYLLDYWDDPKLIADIEKVIHEHSKIVTEIKKIRLRRAGAWILGEVYLEIPVFIDSRDMRSEINRLQEKIHELNPNIKDMVIYFKIPRPRNIRIAIPICDKNGIESKVAMNTAEARYYMFIELEKREIKSTQYAEIDLADAKKITTTIELLKRENIDLVMNNNLSSMFYYSLQHIHHIAVYPLFPNVETVDETVKLFVIDA